MGQYWKAMNLDKKEFIDPWTFNSGGKLCEQLWNGTGDALLILVAEHKAKRGSGDLEINDTFMGRWAGDRVIMVGDYAEKGEIGFGLWDKTTNGEFENIGTPEFRAYVEKLKA